MYPLQPTRPDSRSCSATVGARAVSTPEHVISDDDLLTLLHAAQWAPSAGNSQPWSFLVARRGDQTHDVLVDQLSRGNASWVSQASAILIAIAQVGTGLEEDAPDFSEYAEYDLGRLSPT